MTGNEEGALFGSTITSFFQTLVSSPSLVAGYISAKLIDLVRSLLLSSLDL